MSNITNLINELHDLSNKLGLTESRLFDAKLAVVGDFELLNSKSHTAEINSLEAEKTALIEQIKIKTKQLNNILN